jgi:hypothetical protein
VQQEIPEQIQPFGRGAVGSSLQADTVGRVVYGIIHGLWLDVLLEFLARFTSMLLS